MWSWLRPWYVIITYHQHVMVYTRRVYSSPFYVKAILKHIYSNNPRILTEWPGRKAQWSGQRADCPSWPHTPNTKACRTVLPSGAEKDQALLSCVFLHAFPMHTGHSEEHAQSSLSWARLLMELPQGPALGSPMGCTMFISAPQQDCLNSSKMVMKLYWSFEHSFSDPDRNILAALKKKFFSVESGKRARNRERQEMIYFQKMFHSSSIVIGHLFHDRPCVRGKS